MPREGWKNITIDGRTYQKLKEIKERTGISPNKLLEMILFKDIEERILNWGIDYITAVLKEPMNLPALIKTVYHLTKKDKILKEEEVSQIVAEAISQLNKLKEKKIKDEILG